jgi:hypothetical protein
MDRPVHRPLLVAAWPGAGYGRWRPPPDLSTKYFKVDSPPRGLAGPTLGATTPAPNAHIRKPRPARAQCIFILV